MANINRKRILTISASVVAALLVGSFTGLIFKPWLISLEEKQMQKMQLLENFHALSLRKENLEKEWEKQKPYFIQSREAESGLNLWTKDLLAYATSENLVFSKLEPQGIQDLQGKKGKKEAWLYLEFQGDIQKLVRFLYHLMEKDPSARLEGLSMKKGEGEVLFQYEMILARPLQGGP